jgi:hypothetical protein
MGQAHDRLPEFASIFNTQNSPEANPSLHLGITQRLGKRMRSRRAFSRL